MSKESPTPMAADESCTEAIFLGGKVGGDKEKGVQWDTIYADQCVLPLADGRECGRNVLLELGNRIRAVATEEVNMSSSNQSGPPFRNVQWRKCHAG